MRFGMIIALLERKQVMSAPRLDRLADNFK
jgi:hypothetical protein